MEELLKLKDGKFQYANFDSRDFCAFCLIKKSSKVRHVKKLNLCVRNFHFYSKFFDKIVFDGNYRVYVFVLLFNFLFTLLGLFGNFLNFSINQNAPMYMFIVDFFNDDFVFWQKLISAFNILMIVGFSVDIFVQFVANSYNLTYDELFRPQYYPYLYKKISGKSAIYENPNGKGFLNNWKLFLRRMIRI